MPKYLSYGDKRPQLGDIVEYRGDAVLAMPFLEDCRNYGTLGSAGDGTLQGITQAQIDAGKQPWGQDGLSLDGVDDYAEFAIRNVLDNKYLTVSALIRPLVTTTTYPRIVDRVYDGQFSLYYGSDGRIGVALTTTTGASDNTVFAPIGTLSMGVWQYIVLTFDGTYVILYKNGIEVARVSRGGKLNPTSLPLRIGQRVDVGSNRSMAGDNRNTEIHDRALSPTEVAELSAEPYRDYYKIVPVYYSIPQQVRINNSLTPLGGLSPLGV
jgi:hypothetical protein